MGPSGRGGVDNMVDLGQRLAKRSVQLGLLERIRDDSMLLKSKILSSVQLKVGKSFHYGDLERKKDQIVWDAREKIISLCAIVEAKRDISDMNHRLRRGLQNSNEARKELVAS